MTGALVFARLRRVVLVVGLVFASVPLGSALADTTIGQVGGVSGIGCGSGSGQVRADTAYVVPPGGGTITSFSFQSTPANRGQQLEFLVLRPAGGDSYTVVGNTGLISLRGTGVETFSANPPLAVQGGDILGEWTPSLLNGCLRSVIQRDIIHSFINVPDPGAGQMVSLPDVDEAGSDLNESANLSHGLRGPHHPHHHPNGGGNSANAKLCQHGGWRTLLRSDHSSFASQGACVSYAARGGTFALPKGAGPPSVAVQQTTYPCPSDSTTTCWGTLLASGLPPGSSLTGFAPQVPGNTGQGVDIDVEVDGSGNVNTQLDLLCNNPFGVTNPNVVIDATSVTPSISVSAPDSCG